MSQWVQMSNGIGTDIRSLTVNGNNIFAGASSSGVFLSTNNGASWSAVNNGLPGSLTPWELITLGTNIFAGFHGDGVYKSTNNGTSWTAVNNGLTNLSIRSFAVSGTNLFAGTSGGVFLSTNSGTSWTAVNNGIPTLAQIEALAFLGTNLFAGDDGYGVFVSTNNGTSWTAVNNGLTDLNIRTFAVTGINIFAGTKNGLFKSTNNGTSWTAAGLANQYFRTSVVTGINIFTGSDSGVYLSTNSGISWLNKNQGFNTIPTVYALLITNNFIFAGTGSQSVWRRSLSEMVGIKNINSEIPDKYSLSQNYPNPFNPSTNIKFQVKNSGFVKLVVFDLLGKEIATLVNEKLQPGTYEATFDASKYSSGVYFYRLTTENYSETKKMTLIK